jgi:hypothetical protein
LKPNTLFFFFSTNFWYIDTYPENLILEAMQVLLGAATFFFYCCRRVAAFGSQDLALKTWVLGPSSPSYNCRPVLGPVSFPSLFSTSSGHRHHFSLRPMVTDITFPYVQWSQTDRRTHAQTQQVTLYIRLSWFQFGESVQVRISFKVLANRDWN